MTIDIAKSGCTGCSYCVLGCPTQAIQIVIDKQVWPTIDESKCIECGDCLYLCPNNVFSAPWLEAKPVELEDGYDAIVVGAGIGGLITAAGLGKAGEKGRGRG